MIKTAFAAAAAATAFAAPAAFAGPYVNVETNAGWTGADYTGAATDFHVGYEGALGESASCAILIKRSGKPDPPSAGNHSASNSTKVKQK
jgi:hypothetical protein